MFLKRVTNPESSYSVQSTYGHVLKGTPLQWVLALSSGVKAAVACSWPANSSGEVSAWIYRPTSNPILLHSAHRDSATSQEVTYPTKEWVCFVTARLCSAIRCRLSGRCPRDAVPCTEPVASLRCYLLVVEWGTLLYGRVTSSSIRTSQFSLRETEFVSQQHLMLFCLQRVRIALST